MMSLEPFAPPSKQEQPSTLRQETWATTSSRRLCALPSTRSWASFTTHTSTQHDESTKTAVDVPIVDPLAKLGWPFCGRSSEAPNCPVGRSFTGTLMLTAESRLG